MYFKGLSFYIQVTFFYKEVDMKKVLGFLMVVGSGWLISAGSAHAEDMRADFKIAQREYKRVYCSNNPQICELERKVQIEEAEIPVISKILWDLYNTFGGGVSHIRGEGLHNASNDKPFVDPNVSAYNTWKKAYDAKVMQLQSDKAELERLKAEALKQRQ